MIMSYRDVKYKRGIHVSQVPHMVGLQTDTEMLQTVSSLFA